MPPPFGRDGFGMRPGMEFGPERGMEDSATFKKRMKDHFIDSLEKDLSLTEKQKARISKIMDENEHEFLATRKEMKKTFDDMNAKIDARILQVLDDKQKEKFKEISHRLREHGPEGPPPGPRGFGGDHP
jgi:Spy/CpxP family protein refolding chaperone